MSIEPARLGSSPSALFVLAIVALLGLPAIAPLRAQTDLDDFMRQVIVRRDDNWKKLQQYILDEREQIELRGPNLQPLWGERREYSWYIRDGFFVRSPVRFNGVAIGEAERRKYEADYLRRMRQRDARAQQPAAPAPGNGAASGDPTGMDGLIRQVREPQFVSSAYFLRFKFEEGKYAIAGHETLDNQNVVRVEYYPTNLFSDRQRRRMARNHDPADPKDAEIQRMMNKVALVTMWIDPTAHQIVKYTFDNVDLDFLPAQWLLRLDNVRATMTMHRPFPDVWLPRDLEIVVDAQVAAGRFGIRWGVEYRDYRLPDVKSKFSVVPDR